MKRNFFEKRKSIIIIDKICSLNLYLVSVGQIDKFKHELALIYEKQL